jgi:hypothetical protein
MCQVFANKDLDRGGRQKLYLHVPFHGQKRLGAEIFCPEVGAVPCDSPDWHSYAKSSAKGDDEHQLQYGESVRPCHLQQAHVRDIIVP